MQYSTTDKIEIILVRHGATPGNLEKRYIGSTDEELTAEAKDALSKMDLGEVDLIITSPLLRTKQTAEILWGTRNTIAVPKLREMDFGKFEGMNYKELSGDPDYQSWIDGGGVGAFPEGESREDFITRTMSGFDNVVDMAKRANAKRIGMAVHGGTIMAIMSILIGGEYFSYQVGNGDGYVLTIERGDLENEISYTSLSDWLSA